jgi:hypothetical protein
MEITEPSTAVYSVVEEKVEVPSASKPVVKRAATVFKTIVPIDLTITGVVGVVKKPFNTGMNSDRINVTSGAETAIVDASVVSKFTGGGSPAAIAAVAPPTTNMRVNTPTSTIIYFFMN